MDKTTLNKIEDALTDHRRTVSNRISNGKFTYDFQENVHQDFNNFISMVERKLDSAELLSSSTREFLYSEAPVTYSEIDKFVQSHGEQAVSAFLHATTRASEETLDTFQAENATDEDKLDTFSSTNKRKHGIVEGQKEEDNRENKRIIQNRVAPLIEDLLRQVQQIAVRTNPASEIEEKLSYFRNSSRPLVEDIVQQIGSDFDRHTSDIYDFIDAEMQKFESTILQESGLGELSDKEHDNGTTIQVEEEPIYTQELADLFKSGEVDTSKLSPGELSLYLNYLFDGPMPEIVQTNNKDAFRDSTKDDIFIDTLPASVLDEPTQSSRLDVSPELQPLSPEELNAYNQRVAAARSEINDKRDDSKNKTENDKKVESLPEIDFF